MRNGEKGCSPLALLWGLILGLYLSTPAFAAFTPSPSPLLSAAAVTPNVMLLVDDSGSMNNIIWASGFDTTVTRPQLYLCTSSSGFSRTCSNYAQLDMDNENYLLSTFANYSGQGGCSSGYYHFSYLVLSVRVAACLKLPDPVGSNGTRYTAKYLSYLTSLAVASGVSSKDYTVSGVIPQDYRINVARNAATSLVNNNRGLRIGLATFNSPRSGDSGPGGYIVRGIADLQATSSTTSSTATTNYNSLLTAISGLGAVANTPLAETYYEITRYMRGMTPYYNSTPSTYTSPIQYRCQKNYGVIITDGLPTYDRTFPTNDPLGGSNLPNWDGVNNDGDNLSGDGEGDTLYLDDIAKFAYDIDMLSTGTDAAGKSWNATDFPKQNMYTYTVGFTAANDMLSDAASYGHGQYYQATDSSTLSTALSSALNNISSKAGSGGGGASDSSTLTSATYYYQTLYDPTDWRGIIRAFRFNSDGSLPSTPTWTTNTTMAVGTTTPTFESWNNSTNAPITMSYANYATAQKTTLSANLPTGITGTNLVEWAKGTNITGLKTRTVLLGDIINSPLTLASASDQTASDLTTDSTYTAYLALKSATMTSSLVVNANDGFVDVLNASTGARRYGYMPSTVLASLYQVADTGYINGTSHTFLNDGQVGVYDAQISSSWKTVAVGGVGGAGKGFYAIQLYDATAGNTVKALWEIRADTSSTYADLGYAYAKPEVARMPDGTWAAFIANGFGSTSGVAALYIVSLADGSLIKKIVVDSTETDNGLASVKLSVNASNVVQAAYGGDLKGRVWKFDLSSTSTSSWNLAFSGKPLFTAPGTTTQPITAQPLLVDNTTNVGKMVYIGTGKMLETTDKTTTASQGFYAIWDATGSTTGNFTVSNLQAQAINGTFSGTSGTYITTTENTVDYTTKKGWYLPIVYGTTLNGERVIYQAAYRSGRIIFTTAGVDTTDPCSSTGFGKIVELDAFSGSMLSYAVIDTNGDGVVDSNDTRSSGVMISSGIPTLNAIVDVPGSGTTANKQMKYVNTSSGDIVTLTEKGGATGSKRIMWRQIQ